MSFRPVLYPLSLPYRFVSSAKNFFYDQGILKKYDSALPVLCVGNVSAGGSGKTPIVQSIARSLKDSGYRPVVLLRGYGGSEAGPLQVSDLHSAKDVGDEALLHHVLLDLPVVVARDRVVGAQFIEKNTIGDVIILDDGYQHRRLGRNFNILSLDARDAEARKDFVADRLLPFGKLRESMQQALKRADYLVLHHRGPKLRKEELSTLRAILPSDTSSTEMWIEQAKVIRSESSLSSPHEIVAVSGIAKPEGFIAVLEELGFTVLEHLAFGDHKPLDEGKIAALRRKFPEAPFICTEKDYVRLSRESRGKWWRCVPQYEFASEDLIEAVLNVVREFEPKA